jgi:hypothetical protein
VLLSSGRFAGETEADEGGGGGIASAGNPPSGLSIFYEGYRCQCGASNANE